MNVRPPRFSVFLQPRSSLIPIGVSTGAALILIAFRVNLVAAPTTGQTHAGAAKLPLSTSSSPKTKGPISLKSSPGPALSVKDPVAVSFMRAVREAQTGSLPAAIRDFQEVVRRRPDLDAARYDLGAALLRAGRRDEALSQLSIVAHGKRPDSHLRMAAQLQLALAYEGGGDVKKAQDELSALLQANPKNADALGEMARIAARKGDLTTASHYLARYLAIAPNNPVARYNLGAMYARSGRLKEALRLFQQSAANPEALPKAERIAALLNIGVLYDRIGGHPKEAAAAYARATHYDPNNASAWTARAVSEQRIGETDAAMSSYRQALRISPNSLAALFNLGVLLSQRGQFKDAAVDFRRALQVDPHNASTRANLAYSLIMDRTPATSAAENKGRLQEARKLYEEAEKETPQEKGLYAGLAFVDESLGDLAGAESQAEKLLKLAPTDSAVMGRLASLYARDAETMAAPAPTPASPAPAAPLSPAAVAKWNRAIEVARQQANLHLHDDAGWLALSNYQTRAHRPEDAASTLRYFLTLQPGDVKTQIRLADLLSASPAHAEEARSLYEAVLNKDPSNVQAAMGFASLVKEKDPKAVIARLDKALPSSSGSNWFMLGSQLALLHKQLHQDDQVSAVYETMLKLADKPGEPAATRKQMEPSLKEIHHLLADSYKEQGPAKYGAAEKAYEDAMKLYPTDESFITGAASIDDLQHQPAAALKLYRQAANIAPSDIVALTGLLRTDRQVEKDDSAVKKTMQAFLASHIRDKDLPTILGAFRYAAGDAANLSLVESVLTGLQAQFPTASAVSESLAALYVGIGSSQKALAVYDGLVKRNPKEPAYLAGKAEAEERMNQLEPALADYRAAARLEPKDPRYSSGIVRILERIPARRGELETALRSTLAVSPQDISAADRLTALFTGPDAARKKIEIYQDLATRSQHIPVAAATYYVRLGNLYRAENQPALARKQYQEALRIEPGSVEAMVNLRTMTPAKANPSVAGPTAPTALPHPPPTSILPRPVTPGSAGSIHPLVTPTPTTPSPTK